jgi:hypothetical protein
VIRYRQDASTNREGRAVSKGDKVKAYHSYWKMSIGQYEYTFVTGAEREAGIRAKFVETETDHRPETCKPRTPGNFYGDCKCGKCKVREEREVVVRKRLMYAGDNYETLRVTDPATGNRYEIEDYRVEGGK